MTFDEALRLPSDAPIILADGQFGIVIRWHEGKVGVQVPGEEDIRWLKVETITDLGNGALIEVKKVETFGDFIKKHNCTAREAVALSVYLADLKAGDMIPPSSTVNIEKKLFDYLKRLRG